VGHGKPYLGHQHVRLFIVVFPMFYIYVGASHVVCALQFYRLSFLACVHQARHLVCLVFSSQRWSFCLWPVGVMSDMSFVWVV
jgi:hypothetical protein